MGGREAGRKKCGRGGPVFLIERGEGVEWTGVALPDVLLKAVVVIGVGGTVSLVGVSCLGGVREVDEGGRQEGRRWGNANEGGGRAERWEEQQL